MSLKAAIVLLLVVSVSALDQAAEESLIQLAAPKIISEKIIALQGPTLTPGGKTLINRELTVAPVAIQPLLLSRKLRSIDDQETAEGRLILSSPLALQPLAPIPIAKSLGSATIVQSIQSPLPLLGKPLGLSRYARSAVDQEEAEGKLILANGLLAPRASLLPISSINSQILPLRSTSGILVDERIILNKKPLIW